MKQIPNLFTLLNLVFGCIAIVLVLQPVQQIVTVDEMGTVTSNILPERIAWGALFIFLAAVVDFLDGFVARLLKAESPMGAQLDSLSDVVSFGVAPGMILYQLLRRAYAGQENGLDISVAWLLPAFVFTAAVAWRLAKFNISTDQKTGFKGVPSPAAGLVTASLALIAFYDDYNVDAWLVKPWVLYLFILIVSYLMVSRHRFLALKFKSFNVKKQMPLIILAVVSIILIVLLRWTAVPLIFILYVILSLASKPAPEARQERELTDVTV